MAEAKREILLSSALEWRRFNIAVGVALSYMAWGREKMLALRQPLRRGLLKACRFLQRSEVNDTLVFFGLLDTADVAELEVEGVVDGGGASSAAGACFPILVRVHL